MIPSMPPFNLSLATSSSSGDINAPNTVNFGGFGFGGSAAGAGGGGALSQWWPWLAAGAVALVLIRRK